MGLFLFKKGNKMKHKILSILLAFTMLFSFASNIVLASSCYVLNTWTEVDAGSDLEVTTQNITYDAEQGDSFRVYNDFGSNYWSGDFQFRFDWKVNTSVSSSNIGLMLISNTLGTEREHTYSSKFAGLSLYMSNPSIPDQVRVQVEEVTSDNTTYESGSYLVMTEGTQYYFTLIRDETIGSYGRITLYRYTDAERTENTTSIYIDLHEKQDFRYIHAVTGYGGSGAYTTTGVFGTLCSYANAPDVSTTGADDIEYDPYMSAFEATISGNVTDDGGQEAECGFFYRIKDTGDFSWIGADGTYATGEQFETQITNLDSEVTYEYYAYASNEGGYDEGSTLEFETTFQTGSPDITTLMYPIEYFTDEPTSYNVTVYGYVLYDGGANVTGDFQYKLSDNATWIWSTSNMTDLQTDDQFYYNISSITKDVQYDFRAIGTNEYGTTVNGIGHFVLYDSVAPTMTTLPAKLITSTSAWISGNVTDDGGEPVNASFKWRRLGVEDWNSAGGAVLETGEDYSNKLEGLNSSTTYQYRAYGWHGLGENKTEGYGDIHTFYTYDAVSVPLLTTDNCTYSNEYYAIMRGTVDYDGGSPVAVNFQYRLSGDSVWTETEPSNSVVTGYSVSHLTYDLDYGATYEYRVKGINEQGTGYGLIDSYTHIAPDDTETQGETPATYFMDIFEDIKSSLGLYGIMGTWAFMFIILVLVAMVFGSAMFACKEHTARMIVGVCWALISATVVGGFLFTGQLGVWPIVIIVSIFVFSILAFAGSKLSGSGQDI